MVVVVVVVAVRSLNAGKWIWRWRTQRLIWCRTWFVLRCMQVTTTMVHPEPTFQPQTAVSAESTHRGGGRFMPGQDSKARYHAVWTWTQRNVVLAIWRKLKLEKIALSVDCRFFLIILSPPFLFLFFAHLMWLSTTLGLGLLPSFGRRLMREKNREYYKVWVGL